MPHPQDYPSKVTLVKEALFGPSVARGGYADTYESSQLLHPCHDKGGHDDTDQSDDSKEEEEEEEEQGGAKKVRCF
nr:unnamed protein product [Haemonchus contortus]